MTPSPDHPASDPASAHQPHTMAVADHFGKARLSGWRLRLYEVIFESDSPAGKAFDVALILTIVLSVVAVMLESISAVQSAYGGWLRVAEWVFTILFTVEYVLRLVCVGRPLRYARSFFGIVDLLAVLPTYLSVLFPGAQYFLTIRLLRVLRIFRVLKLAAYLTEANVLATALRASRRKIEVFLFTVLTAVVVLGSMMYFIEGADAGFTSIPRSIYWAIVTLTTVGYGDISPASNLGQALAAVIMIVGYGIIAVPTGIVTAEIARAERGGTSGERLVCPACRLAEHDVDAVFCKRCGTRLPRPDADPSTKTAAERDADREAGDASPPTGGAA